MAPMPLPPTLPADGQRCGTSWGLRAFTVAAILVVAGLTLSACQQAASPPPVASSSAIPGVTRSDFRLPEGSGCSGEVTRFRAVMDNDLETGHVARSVYDQVIREIDGAASACSAGRDGEAVRMINTTKTRFGYP
jgi:hypothetical protein